MCSDGDGGCVVVWHKLRDHYQLTLTILEQTGLIDLGKEYGVILEYFSKITIDSDPVKIVGQAMANFVYRLQPVYSGQIKKEK